MSDEMKHQDQSPATKADLRDFATKADLEKFATKDDIVVAIREAMQPIAVTLAHHTAELADIRSYIKTSLVTRDEFHTRMDGFARRVEDHDWSAAKNRSRLDDHEKRIDALERKSS
jgi:hypothetical protein